jgi:hypothetical protein
MKHRNNKIFRESLQRNTQSTKLFQSHMYIHHLERKELLFDLPCFAIDPRVLWLGSRHRVRHNGEPQMVSSLTTREEGIAHLKGHAITQNFKLNTKGYDSGGKGEVFICHHAGNYISQFSNT